MDDEAIGEPVLDDQRRDDAQLVERVRAGDERAFAEIYDKWFDRVHDLALRIVRNPETASEVAQDTFLAAWRKLDSLEQTASLGGWLLRIARNRALNRNEREQRSTSVGDDTLAAIEARGGQVSAPAGFRVEERVARADDPAIAAEDNEAAALLWSAAGALGERDQTVLSLQLRYGMTPAEIGEALGVNRNAANQMVHRVKGRLDAAVQARVLWNGERPGCEQLEAELVAAGIEEFGPAAVKIAEKHASDCDVCGERRRLRLQPAALFSALPVLFAPALLKQKVAAALASEGVPIDPTDYAAAGSDGLPGSGSGASGDRRNSGSVNDGSALSRRGRVLLAVAAAVVLAVLVGMLAISAGNDAGDEVVAGPAGDRDDERADERAEAKVDDEDEPSVSGDPTSTIDTTSTVAPDVTDSLGLAPNPDAAGDQAEPVAPPIVQPDPGGAAPPGPTPPDPPEPINPITRFTLAPSTMSGSFYLRSSAPRLTWSVLPGFTTTLTGPGWASGANRGDEPLCPNGPPLWSTCPAVTGQYAYRIDVRDSGGALVEQRVVRLTLTP